MLLNEFLKEHRKVQALKVNAAHQQKQIDALLRAYRKSAPILKRANLRRKWRTIRKNCGFNK